MSVSVVRLGSGSAVKVASVQDEEVIVVPIRLDGRGDGERWWKGVGAPPSLIVGSRPGDFYWDTTTGAVYELQEA